MTASDKNINTSFIWNYNLGDNIVFNTEILESLYCNLDVAKPENIKPIVLISASVIEALMLDFAVRVQENKNEPLNLSPKKINGINRLDINERKWKFYRIVETFEEHQVLGDESNYYANVQYLRDMRNRIHIRHHSAGRRIEWEAWTVEVRYCAEACVEYTLLYLSKNFPRCTNTFVKDAVISWQRQFPDEKRLKWENIHVPTY